MVATKGQTIVVTGATGLQGSAVSRQLLQDGWHVRALTRNVKSKPAQALRALGAEVVQGDMGDSVSLQSIFQDAYGVFSVQNPMISGLDAEVRQGKTVADVAKQAGVQHLVYGSAGTGRKGTGIGSWESKLEVEEHMQELELPLTIVRPMAFMELMTHKKFYPAVSTWHLMPKLMGVSRKLPWICADDLGAIVARAFEDPDQFIGKELQVASDAQSLDACRVIYREVFGRGPARFPMPLWMFQRLGFIGSDLTTMWRWLRTGALDVDIEATRALLPNALSVRDWLHKQLPLSRAA